MPPPELEQFVVTVNAPRPLTCFNNPDRFWHIASRPERTEAIKQHLIAGTLSAKRSAGTPSPRLRMQELWRDGDLGCSMSRIEQPGPRRPLIFASTTGYTSTRLPVGVDRSAGPLVR
jgi:hypothetical protein